MATINDKAVTDKMKNMFENFVKKGTKIDSNLRGAVFGTVAKNGNAAGPRAVGRNST